MKKALHTTRRDFHGFISQNDKRQRLIAIWYLFYQICLDEPELRSKIEGTENLYADWGDARGENFLIWWAEHKTLFEEPSVRVIDEIDRHSEVLNISIPLSLPTTITIPEIRRIIKKNQLARLEDNSIGKLSIKKSLRHSSAKYHIVDQRELRINDIMNKYVIFRNWIKHGKPPCNNAFCQAVREAFIAAPGPRRLPPYLIAEGTPDADGNPTFDDNQLRQLRRALSDSQKIAQSVASGHFPNLPDS